MTEVPATLGQLMSLQALVLCDNLIENIPSSIAKLHQLKSLLLHKNRIKALPPEIVTLKYLTEVSEKDKTFLATVTGTLQLSLRDNPLVVRFISDMTYNPGTLMELAARVVKIYNIKVTPGEVPSTIISYLNSANRCVNPKCKGTPYKNYRN